MALALALVAGAFSVRATAAPGLLVSVDDDSVKWFAHSRMRARSARATWSG
jgi:hypothetical protein